MFGRQQSLLTELLLLVAGLKMVNLIAVSMTSFYQC